MAGFDFGGKFGYGVTSAEEAGIDPNEPGAGGVRASDPDARAKLIKMADEGSAALKKEDEEKEKKKKERWAGPDNATSGPNAGKDLVLKNDPSRRAIGPALESSWRGGRP